MNIIEASGQWQAAIIQLLRSQNLPTEDLPADLQDFYVAIEENKLVGLIGLERYGAAALLRSMVVDPAYRNRQVAGKLVQQVEEKAKSAGIHSIYLLTETAEGYFDRKGYRKIGREEVPDAVKGSSEFSHVCPVSATVMQKQLAQMATPVSS